MKPRAGHDEEAIYVISVAAELAGVHPQTLRVYERKGLVNPSRTQGNTRRYSDQDINLLRRIQELTNEGVNLAGVTRILELEHDLERLRAQLRRASSHLEETQEQLSALLHGNVEFPLVPLRDVRRIRRAMKSDALEEASRRRVFAAPPIRDDVDES